MNQDRHIPALDGLRGAAALLVISSHLPLVGFHRVVEDKLGNYGVIIFFALSGFLMGHLYLMKTLDTQRVIHYVAARISRIVPLYVVAVIISFLVYRFIDKGFIYPIGVIQLLRLLTFNGSTQPFWSISPEFQFYGVFLLIWLLAAYRGPYRTAMVVATGVVTGICYLTAPWTPGILFPSKLHIFVLGMAAAVLRGKLINGGIDRRVVIGAQLVSLVFLILLILPVGEAKTYLYPHLSHDPKQNFYYLDMTRCALCTLVVLSFSFTTKLGLSLFGTRPMRLLGMYSFSLYLLHEAVLYELARHASIATLPAPLALLLGGGTILAVSVASFHLFENPSRIALGNIIIRTLSRWFGSDRRPLSPTVKA